MYCINIILLLITDVNPGLIGLSLTYVLLLTDVFAFTIRLSSEVESLVRFNLPACSNFK